MKQELRVYHLVLSWDRGIKGLQQDALHEHHVQEWMVLLRPLALSDCITSHEVSQNACRKPFTSLEERRLTPVG
jgi:hypothetical protein